MNQFHVKIFCGVNEKRYISKIKVNSIILKNILNSVVPKISFNLMMMTTDNKVLLLERTQSFHFPKVVKDLKTNTINFQLLDTLYPVELEKIRKIFFDFMPPFNLTESKVLHRTKIHIFPGGHSLYNEKIALTLLRELQEEIGCPFAVEELNFNQSCIFKMLIYDSVVKKTFNNFVFPVKVNDTSNNLFHKFKDTKHTRNPTFVDIGECQSLFDAFIKVQECMLL
ncbi:hypothetical protein WIV_gp076 [Wiseana iridescent virus]|uniref:Uncharacterized protein n=1 Tax=Wiseana iridescent virus TaxID=68347 RepID=G0T5A2_IRV9|nr:hypothetical protein WIV_gp076 [Wiseana iridescent virus]ADO00419.1 hypothetical protein [Wiseana iridescent virus]